ncbi:MAG TPA: YceI family protein [Polyangia bacterium]|nr:YceI family protein [Polyangia bacterium]
MSRIEPAPGREPRKPTAGSPTADLERWEVDPGRSKLTFTLRHLVVSEIRGAFHRWGGTLFLDRRHPLLSTIVIWIDTASIDTDSPDRDDHIRSAEFLDVKQHPRAEFESSAIEPRNGRCLVRGRLQLHGVAHDVDVEIVPYAVPGQGDTVYRASGKLDRQSFGLHWNQDLDVGGVVLSDEVRLSAELVLARASGDTNG